MRIPPQMISVLWLGVGYFFLFPSVYYHNPYFFLASFPVSFMGLLVQPRIAEMKAAPKSFIKAIRRSFHEESTNIEQLEFENPPLTYYADCKCGSCGDITVPYNHRYDKPDHWKNMEPIGPNMSIAALDEPWEHAAFGKQWYWVLEHWGEFEDHVKYETMEISYFGAPEVTSNKCAILDSWEAPRVKRIGVTNCPIHVPAKGTNYRQYRSWVDSEIAKEQNPQVKQKLMAEIRR